MKKSFFAFISRMKYINRWALMKNTQSDNLMEHSLQVAMIAHAIAVIRNEKFAQNEEDKVDANRVAVLAMYHDASETITGDMPTPIKYYREDINVAYKEIEIIANKKLIGMLNESEQGIYHDILLYKEEEKELWEIVKAADKISAHIKCLDELNMGNRDFELARAATLEKIKMFDRPEVKYFIEEYLPAFERSIDEL